MAPYRDPVIFEKLPVSSFSPVSCKLLSEGRPLIPRDTAGRIRALGSTSCPASESREPFLACISRGLIEIQPTSLQVQEEALVIQSGRHSLKQSALTCVSRFLFHVCESKVGTFTCQFKLFSAAYIDTG
ncbi:peflin [Platysternon megacephalum]|uniref:Peflin n=1 Tax=Platysternon megacephalum TaxID=55544 RepID=A0A4D9ETK5_9SAUR|nr:peflin [Platysternon megacephalum]